MLKDIHWKHYIKYGIIAAILYGIPVFYLLQHTRYSQIWLLYLGNALFMATVASFLLIFNRHRDKNASSMSMAFAGAVVTVLGVILSIFLCFILLSSMVPGLFHSGPPGKVLTGAPANTIQDKTDGLIFMLFGNAIIGNFAAGLFVSIIFPFTLKGDQTKEKVAPHQSQV